MVNCPYCGEEIDWLEATFTRTTIPKSLSTLIFPESLTLKKYLNIYTILP